VAEDTESLKSRVVRSRGDFYVPGLAYGGICAFVPGAPDDHRRLFLTRAAQLEPKLLDQLRRKTRDERGLSSWCERWHLGDIWCRALAKDTLLWYASNPAAEGWEFETAQIAVGHFPFKINPLVLKSFHYDPTYRTRARFKKFVLAAVTKELDSYCDQTERDAVAAGLKRTPRKLQTEHFDWLARYQVREECFAEIARTASYRCAGGRQTVRKAILKLAEYLHLTLRVN